MKNKKAITLSIIASIILLVLIIGATYAYFQASGGDGTSANLRVTTYTTDVFNFEVGSDISIYADATSFASGKGNASGNTFAKAILTANNKTNSATENYNLFLNISDNTFVYSVDTNTPELILTIKDKSNNEVTSIEGLTYKAVTDGKGTTIKGFDITNKKGLITILNNREITTASTTEETWNVTVTFINYDKDQSKNAGKSFNAKLMIQQEEYELTLADICAGKTLSDCVISQYTGTQGDNALYYHNSTLTNGAGDNSYRYAGYNPNNYVCFGSDEATCPKDNLYRIIGLFGDNIKLVKNDYAGSDLLGTNVNYGGQATTEEEVDYNGSKKPLEKYSFGSNNTWSSSKLNTINLNTNFINNIGNKWSNMIISAVWKVGGNTSTNILNNSVRTVFTNEITNPVNNTYTAKIGLMYVSDFGYASVASRWTTMMEESGYGHANIDNYLFLRFNGLLLQILVTLTMYIPLKVKAL